MVWDPTGLKVKSVKAPACVTNDLVDVTIGLYGAGFSDAMQGVFVHRERDASGELTRERLIPCDWFELVEAGYAALLHICPRDKEGGCYDLVLWNPPPEAGYGENHTLVPVNDVFVFPNALTIQSVERSTREDEEKRVLDMLKSRVGAARQIRGPDTGQRNPERTEDKSEKD